MNDINTYRAKVVRVVDGDTIDLDVDLGFYTTLRIRGRLAGVDTPERVHEDFALATEALSNLLLNVTSDEGYILIKTKKTGKYGRWLVDIDNVNAKLAEAWPYE